MALTVGTNSYINVADADLYFADRLNSDFWDTINPVTKKDLALIQATKMIDFQRFKGAKTVLTQALSFPRTGLIDDGVVVDSLVVPQKIIDATCELALYLLQDDYSAPDDLLEFGNVKVGSIEVTTKGGGRSANGGKALPPFVKSLLAFARTSKCALHRG